MLGGNDPLHISKIDIARVPPQRFAETAAYIDQRMTALVPIVKWLESFNPNAPGQTPEQMTKMQLYMLMRQCDLFKFDAETKLIKLKQDLMECRQKGADANMKIRTHDENVSKRKGELVEKRATFENMSRTRQQLADQLNVAELADEDTIVVIDQRDKSNKIFEWVLEAVYQEPISKYYFPNFRKQVFLKDGGTNLKERLKNFKISSMTSSSSEVTEGVVHEKPDVIKALDKGKPLPNAINVLFSIAENIRDSRKLFVEFTDKEKQLNKIIDEFELVKFEEKKFKDMEEAIVQRIDVLARCLVYYNNILYSLYRKPEAFLKDDYVQNILGPNSTLGQNNFGLTSSINMNQIGGGSMSPINIPQPGMQPGQGQQQNTGAPGDKKDENCIIF